MVWFTSEFGMVHLTARAVGFTPLLCTEIILASCVLEVAIRCGWRLEEKGQRFVRLALAGAVFDFRSLIPATKENCGMGCRGWDLVLNVRYLLRGLNWKGFKARSMPGSMRFYTMLSIVAVILRRAFI